MEENIENKIGTSSCHSIKTIAPVDKIKLKCLDSAVRNIANCNSFITGTGNILLPPQVAEEMLPSTSSLTLKLGNTCSTPSEPSGNYFKEFDSPVDESPFNQFGKFIRSTETAEGVLSFVPEIPPPNPIILNKRRTCRGVLSVNDSTTSLSRENATNDATYETNEESEYKDDNGHFSSKHSNAQQDNSAFVGDGNEQCVPALANQSMLLINQPIRVKCIDEATKHTKEIIIYSDEFLSKRLQETGNMMTEKEVFEDLLNICVNYKGKTLRMITVGEHFIYNLHDNNESHGDISFNSSIKVTKQIPQPDQQKEDVLGTSSMSLCSGDSTNDGLSHKEKKHFVKSGLKKKKVGEPTNAFKLSKSKIPQRIDSPFPGIDKQPKHKYIKRNYENIDTESVKKKFTIARKQKNVENIIASEFKYHFNFYAKLKSRLSGLAISKNNSNFWLKRCGIISNDSDKKIASECFHAAAGVKCLLNIKDYIQYITELSKKLKLIPKNVLHQLMSTDIHSIGY